MKTVSKKDFDRLQRKKGFSAKRKKGATKKPEPEAEDIVALSGAELPEAPVPASPAPAPAPDPKPFAAMAASNAVRDAAFDELVLSNKKIIENFTTELARQRANVPKRVPWDHDLIRDAKTGLLKKIRSTPLVG